MKVLKLSAVAAFAAAFTLSLITPTQSVSSQSGPAEAPAGFDNQTNGFVTQAQFDADRAAFDAVEEVAGAHGVPAAAVALAWLAAQPTVVSPIASARNVDQLADLLPMQDLRLSDDERQLLTDASA